MKTWLLACDIHTALCLAARTRELIVAWETQSEHVLTAEYRAGVGANLWRNFNVTSPVSITS